MPSERWTPERAERDMRHAEMMDSSAQIERLPKVLATQRKTEDTNP